MYEQMKINSQLNGCLLNDIEETHTTQKSQISAVEQKLVALDAWQKETEIT
jgi:hypothetical protein